jgi:hypothetical protein
VTFWLVAKSPSQVGYSTAAESIVIMKRGKSMSGSLRIYTLPAHKAWEYRLRLTVFVSGSRQLLNGRSGSLLIRYLNSALNGPQNMNL